MSNIIKNPNPLKYVCKDCGEGFFNKEETKVHECFLKNKH